MSRARIDFSNSLIDLGQDGSVKIIETDGKFQLCLTIGIKAIKVADQEPGDQEKCRDAKFNKELILTGRGNIRLKKKSSTEDTSIISIAFDGDVGTKVPGTGAEMRLFDFDTDFLTHRPELKTAEV
jgi:hypothetical protein